MNIEQAKAIPISYILQKLNLKPTRKVKHQSWYLSPFRSERTASFQVHDKRNIWYDFGIGIGGDVINLVTAYLESQKQSHSVSDALEWLKNMEVLTPQRTRPKLQEEIEESEPTLIVKSVKAINQLALIHYLDSRGIPLTVAKSILKEVRIHNNVTGKNMFALGLQNEEEGYEIRNPFFKGCVGPKSISFIRGEQPKPDGIILFEGFMDYLSTLTYQEGKPFQHDTIILNSLSCLRQAIPYINNYGYKVAYTWMDNDRPGKLATDTLAKFFKSQENLQHKPMNDLYEPFKDVNAWHMQRLGL